MNVVLSGPLCLFTTGIYYKYLNKDGVLFSGRLSMMIHVRDNTGEQLHDVCEYMRAHLHFVGEYEDNPDLQKRTGKGYPAAS
jgi:hypothetical protein